MCSVDAAYGGMASPPSRGWRGGGERRERARLVVTGIQYLSLDKMLQNIKDIPSYPLEISHIY